MEGAPGPRVLGRARSGGGLGDCLAGQQAPPRSVLSKKCCRASGQCQGGKKSWSRARRTGVECSLGRFEAVWQLLKLREGGSQDGRLHDQAEVGARRRGATSPCSDWWYDFLAAVHFSAKFQARDGPPSHASRKGAHQGARSFTLVPRALFFGAMGNRRVWISVPPWCHRCHRCLPEDHSLWRLGRPFQRGVPYKLMRSPGFGLKVWCGC